MGQVIFFVEDSPGGGFKARAMGYPIKIEALTIEELESSIQAALKDFFKDDTCHYLVRVEQEREKGIAKNSNKN
jgi:hypothetical protein